MTIDYDDYFQEYGFELIQVQTHIFESNYFQMRLDEVLFAHIDNECIYFDKGLAPRMQ